MTHKELHKMAAHYLLATALDTDGWLSDAEVNDVDFKYETVEMLGAIDVHQLVNEVLDIFIKATQNGDNA